jgi:hypothetical protein
MNSTSQCFILWSKVSSPLSVDITLTLRRPLLGLQLPKTFELLTLGPRQSDFFTYKTVPLPPPPASQLKIPGVQFVDNGVMAGCTNLVATDQGPVSAPGASTSRLFEVVRHDVLVPRGCQQMVANGQSACVETNTVEPTGMAHWDGFANTLTVSVGQPSIDGEYTPVGSAVGVGAVVLRVLPPSGTARRMLLALTLHASVGAGVDKAVWVAVRVDYLNHSTVMGSLGWATQNTYVNGSCAWDSLWSGPARATPGWPGLLPRPTGLEPKLNGC